MSLKKRYFFKLITNLTGFAIGLITQTIVPRSLGPASYGNFSFLTGFFWQIAGFLNLNSSTAFYTKLSKRQDDKALVGFYMRLSLVISAILVLSSIVPVLLGFKSFLWPSQRFIFILLGSIWAVLSFYSMVLNDMSDAYGLTVKAESIKIAVKLGGLAIILFMFWKGLFSLGNFFIYQLVILAIPIIFMLMMLSRSGRGIFLPPDPGTSFKPYVREFKEFCLPLFWFTAASMVAQIADRWLLQKFSGSVNQGFYALSYQVGAICFLFTSALIPLLLREQSISHGKNDIEESKRIFKKYALLLYVITAFFCCFIAVEARDVLKFFGGKAYEGALVPLILMSLYPIHQTYGQINGNMFFATERVNTYKNIGMLFVFIGIPFTFIILGPSSYGALQMGASGLAIKMLALQIISTNVQLWYNTKYLGLAFNEFLFHQISVVAIFITSAFLSSFPLHYFFPGWSFVLLFGVSGIIYSSVSLILLLYKPELFSVNRQDLDNMIGLIKSKLEFNRAN
ncbi:MAG: hypothetical protein A2204_01170 [Elusimicrobia bacterium RIFOXYA1_FULL_47_7]|nr:MAG: hypothetical protein A2278_01805 [Elusimicrobia bacterium RIFOXYA12_FULL_49_49]OGS10213.1 MAG: hypothetical protein A2204_01170 [Elusimicrobia bacterium RIFOXYA1_FULL_47_7]OGS16783.1 MAG: hypothetical protein A2251_05255 [Elusimicrobia bacterium RIFOXYA2_FULL_47_53]OGS32011.1 MAG: hypothetical protein A2323_08030 [Elusimicrobia bacterium RIFOXYB2_FULL_46_23]